MAQSLPINNLKTEFQDYIIIDNELITLEVSTEESIVAEMKDCQRGMTQCRR